MDELISTDPSIHKILRELNYLSDMNILIVGESGVGKTPVAQYANKALAVQNGTRPFIRINCAGLNKERLQDELFGHKKGAYTGSDSDRVGQVELANGGDLFLDEIGELDLLCQAELLVFLDSGDYRRLGDSIQRHSKCRIISATNRNLKSMIELGFFRKDLYSRIAQYKIEVPTLRSRKNDLIPIMEHYIKKECGYIKPYSSHVISMFRALDWKDGNVRQLKDAVKYMCRKSKDFDEIDLCHINPDLYDFSAGIKKTNSTESNDSFICEAINSGLVDCMSKIERYLLCELIKTERSIRALAKKIKMPHTTLQRKLKKHNIGV